LRLDYVAALVYEFHPKMIALNSPEAGSPLSPLTPRRFRLFRYLNEYRQSSVIICIILWSVLSYFFISHYVLMAVEVKGISMSPTLLDGQRYLLYRCPFLWRSPRKGEIVVLEDPEDHGLSVKRIVALPHELIEVRRDGVYVNSRKLSEPYLTSSANAASGERPVKPTRLGGEDYFVLGDNRDLSADSRIYGPVPRKNILGLLSKSH
jgi:signal peptidase I